jgi:hypothetical protein
MKSHRSRSEHVGGSMPIVQSRRRFLTDVALTGAAGLGVAGVAGLGATENLWLPSLLRKQRSSG